MPTILVCKGRFGFYSRLTRTGTITLTQDLIARDYGLDNILIGLVNACIILGAMIGSALAGILV